MVDSRFPEFIIKNMEINEKKLKTILKEQLVSIKEMVAKNIEDVEMIIIAFN